MNPLSLDRWTDPLRLYASLGLFGVFLDEFLRDGLGHFLVLGEFHGEFGLALSGRADHGGIAEHFRERHFGLDHGEILVLRGAVDDAAPLVEGAERGALEFGGALDRHAHDRFENHGLAPRVGLAERADGRLLERDVGRIDRVVVAVVDRDPDVDDGKSDERALGEAGVESLFARRDEFLGNGASLDLVDEFEIALLVRLHEAGPRGRTGPRRRSVSCGCSRTASSAKCSRGTPPAARRFRVRPCIRAACARCRCRGAVRPCP